MRTFTFEHVSSPLNASFAISRGAKTSAETIRVALKDGARTGRGESVPYARYGESVVSVTAQIQGIAKDLEDGMTRKDLQYRLPAGAARCAIDCAMWDLEAKKAGKSVWHLAGLPKPKALPTTMTLSLASADEMADAARATAAGILKLKLGGPDDIDRVAAVRASRPDATLILDGNEGLSPATFPALLKEAAKLGVSLIEQPFPVGDDDALLRRPGHVAICADESVHQTKDLQALAKKYDMVNIKLDKAGGFTEALRMYHEARKCGLGVMVGCMVAGSLSMAPALILGQAADLIDLDGPLWLKDDIQNGLNYKDGMVSPPLKALWG